MRYLYAILITIGGAGGVLILQWMERTASINLYGFKITYLLILLFAVSYYRYKEYEKSNPPHVNKQ
jgi:hypothetical protein